MMSPKISVMLVDDNHIDLFIHKEFIKKMGIAHTIMEYPFATEAIKYLEKNDIDKWPQVILLDIHMPIMNGFEFLEKFSTFKPSLIEKCKIIIVSSSLDTGDIHIAKNNPLVIGLMEKPINTDKLMQLLKHNTII